MAKGLTPCPLPSDSTPVRWDYCDIKTYCLPVQSDRLANNGKLGSGTGSKGLQSDGETIRVTSLGQQLLGLLWIIRVGFYIEKWGNRQGSTPWCRFTVEYVFGNGLLIYGIVHCLADLYISPGILSIVTFRVYSWIYYAA